VLAIAFCDRELRNPSKDSREGPFNKSSSPQNAATSYALAPVGVKRKLGGS
jgi:hypothetical protein